MSSRDASDGRVHIRLMNEYSCDPPLWDDDEGLITAEGLRLSEGLLSDLSDFATRWEESVPDDVFDDRWDGTLVMSRLVALRYALLRSRPSARRRARAEDEVLRAMGESLRSRLQRELGDGYAVTYQH